MLAGEGTLDQVAGQVFQDVVQVAEGNDAHAVQDLLVALLGFHALLGVALAVAEAEQLLEGVLQVQLAAPAEALGKGQGHGVAVVDVGKGVGVHGVLDMAADHAGKAVQCQHGTLAGTAAGDDVVGCAGIQQHSGQDAVLHVGQLGSVIGGVHAVVDDLVAHRFHDLAQGGFHQGALGGLAVFHDQCDFHFTVPFLQRANLTKSLYQGPRRNARHSPAPFTSPAGGSSGC